MAYFKTLAGIICDSGAASIKDCHVFVDEGITNPKSKYHSIKQKLYQSDIIHYSQRTNCIVSEF